MSAAEQHQLDRRDAVVQAAYDYVRRGFVVVPCVDKRPRGRKGGGWVELRDGQDVHEHYSQHPDDNVGIRTGAESGLLAIDVDLPGQATWGGLVGQHLAEMPPTRVVGTGSGGRHLVYRYPADRAIGCSPLAPGIDVRAEGGMIVAPPSVSSRGPYEVLVNRPAAEMPDWLLAMLKPPRATESGPIAEGEPIDASTLPGFVLELLAEHPGDGERHRHFFKLVAACRRAGLSQGQTVTLVGPWCKAVGKFVGREAQQVADVWGKVEDEEQRAEEWLPGLTGGPVGPAQNSDVDSPVAAAPASPEGRSLVVTKASDVRPRRVLWLWQDRLALGTLALLAGREGIGKSTVAYQLAADVTRGMLPGERHGQPSGVIVAATEDSREHTIVPRLLAAGADLDRVLFVEVMTAGVHGELSLPRDTPQLELLVREHDVALILLDPLMSRLDSRTDTHRDSEVRRDLEPLCAIADRAGATVIGLIHVNKGTSTDPLTMVMGSRAFTAVSRAVLFCAVDPDNEESRLLGQAKNNLGRTDLPTLTFTIEAVEVADDDGPVMGSRVVWTGSTTRPLREAIEGAAEGSEVRSATAEAADWLEDHLKLNGGTDTSANVKAEGRKAGHSDRSLRAARVKLGLVVTSEGFPRTSYWSLPGSLPEPEDKS
ncbi:bifunctional DNA primase/polymerase [Nocardioides ungokensis]